MDCPAMVGLSTVAPMTPVMPSSSITSETMPLASPSARKSSMIPSGGRGVSILRMRSRAILPVSFRSAIVTSAEHVSQPK
jgi:hypothetical protein